MKLRFGAMNFPVAPILEEIEDIGRLGMDYLELAMDPPQADYHLIRQQMEALVRAAERWKLGLICHLPTFVYTAHLSDAIRKASLDDMIASLETAVDLGAEKIVVHPGTFDGLAVHVPDYAGSLALDSLGTIWRRSEALGAILCVENMFPMAGPFVTPRDFQRIFKSFPGLRLVLDIGHANIDDPGRRRAVDFIIQYSDRLEHLHLSDNHGQMDEHLAPGSGTIDYKSIAAALRKVGYDKTVTLEIFGQGRSALAKSRLMLEKIL